MGFQKKGVVMLSSQVYKNVFCFAHVNEKEAHERCSLYLPHYYLNYFHCGIIQCIEKVHQHLSLFSHFPNNKSKDKTEDYQAKHINAIRVHAHYFVFLGFVL